MRKLVRCLILYTCLLSALHGKAQHTDSSLFLHHWKAYWILPEGADPHAYGVYLFRKQIIFTEKPASFVVHVSADNRYKLFVNETLVSLGPARGDINHWNYETVDLSPYLKAGNNIIAAQVWNEASSRPEAQISLQTGFILQGNSEKEWLVNTDTSWRCTKDSSYQPTRFSVPAYYVAGPGEQIDMNAGITGWKKLNFTEQNWKVAKQISLGNPKNSMGGFINPVEWMLVPSPLPPREETMQRLERVRRAEGISVPSSFPSQKGNLVIPAHKKVTLLLDQNFLTNAYLTLKFGGGKKATISLRYAEALYNKFPLKGNRDEIAGKTLIGRYDSLISNGKEDQEFTTLAFRTFRYIELTAVTQDDPLTITDLYGTFTGYPFQQQASIQSTDSSINTILNIGWRTARLCAWETYTDCPYYEQLQYIGDTRIQGLVSLYNSGDDRLLKNAINQMDNSRQPEGITGSRHPSYTPQFISTFSLWYVSVLHDYMMYGSDTAFIKNKLNGERGVLSYFKQFQQADGSLKNVPYWIFTDWVTWKDWSGGVGPMAKDGTSALLDLQLLGAYEAGEDLENKLGLKEFAAMYHQSAEQLKATIRRKYWDEKKRLFADRFEKDDFSQHTNALAILNGVATEAEAADIGKRILTDTTLAPASIYFKYYLHQAMSKAGYGNDYLSWLDKWRENIRMGLTTWAEMSDIANSRSDCHAWGASPNIELYRTVLGIDSDAPGFTHIKIEPHLGSFKKIGGEMPHPNGKISVSYQLQGSKWNVSISLPPNTTGAFIWQNTTRPLQAGNNKFVL